MPEQAGRRTFVVPDGPGQQRVDRFVADVAGLSRSYVQRLISAERLTHDGLALKANTLVGAGDVLDLDIPPAIRLEVEGESIPLVIAYEDGDLLVVNKPHGLVVHPSPGHDSGTLVNALLGRADGAEYGGIA
ncbi:MAG: RluA family pseudouridine synthase, partial [Candidatus Limnocylindrales bacterium]